MPAASPATAASDPRAALSRPALCDLSAFGILAIDGADAQTFLQGQLSNDVRRLAARTWQYTTYNSPKGRVLANFVLWREDDGYRAWLPLELADSVRKRLSMFVLRSKVAIRDLTSAYARFGLAGPGAAQTLDEVMGSAPTPRSVAAAGDRRAIALDLERWLLLAPATDDAFAAAVSGSAQRGGPELWQWLDVRAGVPVITAATQDQFVLQTANLDALGAVSFDKGCYTGQEIIARTQYLGRLKERLFAWHANAQHVAAGMRLFSSVFGEQACGTVVNAAAAPAGGVDLLAVVQLAAAQAGDVRLNGPAGEPLQPLPLPYAVPEPAAPPRRMA